jgi:uncharacterized circularly permuted ATP-grasp superfamily protein
MADPLILREPLAYDPPQGSFDEVFAQGGVPRDHAQALVAELGRLGPEQLVAAGRRRDAIFMQQGITFDATGDDGPVKDRPFPLDLVPRILPATSGRRSSAAWPSASARSTTSSTTSTTPATSSARGSCRGR